MTDFERLLRALGDGGVEFVIVGGVAGAAHGSARLTQDLDVVYSRSPENIRRLAAALAPLAPYLRGAPPGLPFHWDEATIRRGLNFTLTTTLGSLDLFGSSYRCLDLEWLIRVKRAAGGPRDLDAVAELEALLEERDRPGG